MRQIRIGKRHAATASNRLTPRDGTRDSSSFYAHPLTLLPGSPGRWRGQPAGWVPRPIPGPGPGGGFRVLALLPLRGGPR